MRSLSPRSKSTNKDAYVSVPSNYVNSLKNIIEQERGLFQQFRHNVDEERRRFVEEIEHLQEDNTVLRADYQAMKLAKDAAQDHSAQLAETLRHVKAEKHRVDAEFRAELRHRNAEIEALEEIKAREELKGQELHDRILALELQKSTLQLHIQAVKTSPSKERTIRETMQARIDELEAILEAERTKTQTLLQASQDRENYLLTELLQTKELASTVQAQLHEVGRALKKQAKVEQVQLQTMGQQHSLTTSSPDNSSCQGGSITVDNTQARLDCIPSSGDDRELLQSYTALPPTISVSDAYEPLLLVSAAAAAVVGGDDPMDGKHPSPNVGRSTLGPLTSVGSESPQRDGSLSPSIQTRSPSPRMRTTEEDEEESDGQAPPLHASSQCGTPPLVAALPSTPPRSVRMHTNPTNSSPRPLPPPTHTSPLMSQSNATTTTTTTTSLASLPESDDFLNNTAPDASVNCIDEERSPTSEEDVHTTLPATATSHSPSAAVLTSDTTTHTPTKSTSLLSALPPSPKSPTGARSIALPFGRSVTPPRLPALVSVMISPRIPIEHTPPHSHAPSTKWGSASATSPPPPSSTSALFMNAHVQVSTPPPKHQTIREAVSPTTDTSTAATCTSSIIGSPLPSSSTHLHGIDGLSDSSSSIHLTPTRLSEKTLQQKQSEYPLKSKRTVLCSDETTDSMGTVSTTTSGSTSVEGKGLLRQTYPMPNVPLGMASIVTLPDDGKAAPLNSSGLLDVDGLMLHNGSMTSIGSATSHSSSNSVHYSTLLPSTPPKRESKTSSVSSGSPPPPLHPLKKYNRRTSPPKHCPTTDAAVASTTRSGAFDYAKLNKGEDALLVLQHKIQLHEAKLFFETEKRAHYQKHAHTMAELWSGIDRLETLLKIETEREAIQGDIKRLQQELQDLDQSHDCESVAACKLLQLQLKQSLDKNQELEILELEVEASLSNTMGHHGLINNSTCVSTTSTTTASTTHHMASISSLSSTSHHSATAPRTPSPHNPCTGHHPPDHRSTSTTSSTDSEVIQILDTLAPTTHKNNGSLHTKDVGRSSSVSSSVTSSPQQQKDDKDSSTPFEPSSIKIMYQNNPHHELTAPMSVNLFDSNNSESYTPRTMLVPATSPEHSVAPTAQPGSAQRHRKFPPSPWDQHLSPRERGDSAPSPTHHFGHNSTPMTMDCLD